MTDPIEVLKRLGAKHSPDFDAYASGEIGIAQIRCVMCGKAPCEGHPEFGSPEYFAMIERIHGKG